MTLTDPIGDMLARIKNSQVRNHKKVEIPSSNFKTKIADVLKNEGFINDFKIDKFDDKPLLIIDFAINLFIALSVFMVSLSNDKLFLDNMYNYVLKNHTWANRIDTLKKSLKQI